MLKSGDHKKRIPLSIETRQLRSVGVCQPRAGSEAACTIPEQNWQGFAALGVTQRALSLRKALHVLQGAKGAAVCAALVWLDAKQCVNLWLAHWQAEQNAYLILREKHGDKVMVDIIDLYGSHPPGRPQHIQEECQRLASGHEALLFVTSRVIVPATDIFKEILAQHPQASPDKLASEFYKKAADDEANRCLVVACIAVTTTLTSALIANAAAHTQAEAFYMQLSRLIKTALSTASTASSALFTPNTVDPDQSISQAKEALWQEALVKHCLYLNVVKTQEMLMSETPILSCQPLHLFTKNFYSCFGADTADIQEVQSFWLQLRQAFSQAVAAAINEAMQLAFWIDQLRQHIGPIAISEETGFSLKKNSHQLAKQDLARELTLLESVNDWELWPIERVKQSDNNFHWRISFEAQWVKLSQVLNSYHECLRYNGSVKRKNDLEGMIGKPRYDRNTLNRTIAAFDRIEVVDFIMRQPESPTKLFKNVLDVICEPVSCTNSA